MGKIREFFSNSSLKFIIVTGLAGLLLAFAASQPEDLPGSPALPEDIVGDPPKNKISCGNLVDEIQAFRRLHYENGEATAGFIQGVGTRMWDWMQVFRQLAGQTVTFKKEYFDPIEETAETSDEITQMIYENTDQLDQRLHRISESIEVCL